MRLVLVLLHIESYSISRKYPWYLIQVIPDIVLTRNDEDKHPLPLIKQILLDLIPNYGLANV